MSNPSNTARSALSAKECLRALREAWGKGGKAGPEVFGPLFDKVGPTTEGRELFMKLFSIPAAIAGNGESPAAIQKHTLLAEVAPCILPYALSSLQEEYKAFAASAPASLENIRSGLAFLKAVQNSHLFQKTGESEGAIAFQQVMGATLVAEFALATKKPPHARFLTGLRANSRVSSFLMKAGAMEEKAEFAGNYLLACADKEPSAEKKAEATARLVSIIHSPEYKSKIHPEMCNAALNTATTIASEENETFRILAQAKLRSLLSKNKKAEEIAGDFRRISCAKANARGMGAELRPASEWMMGQMDSSPRQEKVSPEETLLFEPTSWARKIEAGEHIDPKEIAFGYFEGKPAHMLANAALVIANANAPNEESKIARARLATYILLPISGDAFFLKEHENVVPLDGKKKLQLHKSQENLLSAIRVALENPEIKKEVMEYALRRREEPRNSEIADMLISFYENGGEHEEYTSQEPSTKQPEEVQPSPGPAQTTPEPQAPQGPAREQEENEFQESPGENVPGEVAFLLKTISSHNHPYQTRSDAYRKLVSFLSPEISKDSGQELILSISGIALNASPEIAASAAGALISLRHVSGHDWALQDSFLAISSLAEIPPEVSNGPLAENILHGADTEAEAAILSLAARAGKRVNTKDGQGRMLPPRVLAAREVVDSFDSPVAARALIRLAGRGFHETLLLDSLEDLRFISKEALNPALFQAIASNRARREGALFQPPESATGRLGTAEALLCEKYLYGIGGSLESRSESIAKGALLLGGQDACRFIIQKLSDARTPEEGGSWADALREFPGPDADAALMEQYNNIGEGSRKFALEALISRGLSIEKAEFLFGACNSVEGEEALIASSALLAFDFHGAEAEREFELLFSMMQGSDAQLQQRAASLLPSFLEENQDALTPDSFGNFLNLFIDEQDKEVSESARSALLSNPHKLLRGLGAEEGLEERISALHTGEGTIAAASIFALAKEMAADSGAQLSPLDMRIKDAVKELLLGGDSTAQYRFAFAAYASRNPHYLNSVLAPFLGAEEEVSSTVAESLLKLGEPGVEAAARAAGREGLPQYVPKEMAQRISNKAIKLLFEAGEYTRLVPLLGHKENGVRLSAYSFLESAKPGKERDDALFAALGSDAPALKFSALSLLPRDKKYLEASLKAIGDESREVSSRAAEFSASLLTREELISFLAEESLPEPSRQKLADSYSLRDRTVSETLAARIADEESPEDEIKGALLALRFLHGIDSLYALCQAAMGGSLEERELASDSAAYFCEALSEKASTKGDAAREEAFLLLEAYHLFEDSRIREAVLSFARSTHSGVLLDAALASEDPETLFSAANLFLSVSNEEYAAKAALGFRRLGKGGPIQEFTAPFQEILFGQNKEALERLVSPIDEDPYADPLPYRLVKEVAIQELIEGKGAPGSDELLFSFVDRFGDFEGIFDYGLVSVSELAWATRNEDGKAHVSSKLAAMVPDELAGRARLFLELVLEGNHSSLHKLREDKELSELVCMHALRQLAEGIDFVSTASGSRLEKAKSRMLLSARLVEEGILPEESISELSSGTSPALSVLRSRIYSSGHLQPGLDMLETLRLQIRQDARPSRTAIPAQQDVSPNQARADAAKIGRAAEYRAPPPEGRKGQPNRPTRGNGQGN